MAELTVRDQQELDQKRHDQMVELNKKFIKENKKLFNSNAKEFAEMRKSLSADISKMSPALQDQIETLKDVTDDAQTANSRGQKELLKKTKNSIAVLETLKKTDTANSQYIGDLLKTAKEQTGLLKKNISYVDASKEAITSVITDTAAIGIGLLSESPLIAMGIKAFGDAFSKINDARKERKAERQSAIMDALKKNREDVQAGMEDIDAQFSDSTEAFARSVNKQDKIFTAQKKWYESDSSTSSMISSQYQETGPLQVMAVDAKGNAIALGGEAGDAQFDGEDTSALLDAQFDQLEDANKALLEIEKDTSMNRRYNFFQMKFVSEGLLGLAEKLSGWFKRKRSEAMAKRIGGFVETASGAIMNTINREALSTRGALFDTQTKDEKNRKRQFDFAGQQRSKAESLLRLSEDHLGQTYRTIQKWQAFPELFGEIRNYTEDTRDSLRDIHDLLKGEVAPPAQETAKILSLVDKREQIAEQRAEEDRREAAERHRDTLEVMKKNKNTGELEKDDSGGFLDKLFDFLPPGLGLGFGAMGGAALASAMGFTALLSLLGGALFVIGKGALDHLKNNPGEYFDAVLVGFAKLGDLILDAGVWVGKAFGLDMEAFTKENRQEFASDVGLAIDNWFRNTADSINDMFEDILPDSVQKKLEIGKYKRQDTSGVDMIENFPHQYTKMSDDGSELIIDWQKISESMTAKQLQDIRDSGSIQVDQGMLSFMPDPGDRFWKIQGTSKDLIDEMIAMKEKLDRGEISLDEMKAYRDSLTYDYAKGRFQADEQARLEALKERRENFSIMGFLKAQINAANPMSYFPKKGEAGKFNKLQENLSNGVDKLLQTEAKKAGGGSAVVVGGSNQTIDNRQSSSQTIINGNESAQNIDHTLAFSLKTFSFG